MPERMNQDWEKLVRERLASSRACRQDVVTELAAHLEEVYEGASAFGSSPTDAMQRTLQEVEDWDVLATEIARAKLPEDSMSDNTMNHRTKTVLLPTIAVLFAVGLVLLFLDRAAVLQMLIWIACMALLLFAAAAEASRLNLRTKSLWLPGLVSLIAASLFLFAEELVLVHDSSFYFTNLSLKPRYLISGVPGWFYFGWLIAQVLCGALGAFTSRQGGGTRAARLTAGAFPAIVMFAICTVVIPISAVFEHNSFALRYPSTLAFAIFIWAGAPALALLLGAAPFLKEPALS